MSHKTGVFIIVSPDSLVEYPWDKIYYFVTNQCLEFGVPKVPKVNIN